jgi:hypothetical protein
MNNIYMDKRISINIRAFLGAVKFTFGILCPAVPKNAFLLSRKARIPMPRNELLFKRKPGGYSELCVRSKPKKKSESGPTKKSGG